VAKIIKTRGLDGELFPSPTAVSDNLYCCITGAIEEQFGKKLKRITRSAIEKRLAAPEFRNVVFISRKGKTMFLPVTVTDISFPASHECGVVNACLLLPLYGDGQQMQKLIEEIITKIGLKHAHYAQHGIEVEITLSGESLPCQVLNLSYSKNGMGQRAFATKKEILSGCSAIR